MNITFNYVYAKHNNTIRNIISEMLNNTNINIDETVNDVFLHINKSLAYFNPDYKNTTLLNYIIVVCKRKTYDIIRHYQQRKFTAFKYISLDSIDINNIIEDKTDNNVYKVNVKSIFEMLSKDEQKLLTLHFFDSLSYADIAKKLKTPLSTIKVRFFRLKKKVNKHFN